MYGCLGGKKNVPTIYKMESWKVFTPNPRYSVSDRGNVKLTEFGRKIIPKHFGRFYRITDHGIDVCLHQMVAEMFIDNPNGYKYVHHKNGNKHDNRVTNLEWVSRSQGGRKRKDTSFKTSGDNLDQLSSLDSSESCHTEAKIVNKHYSIVNIPGTTKWSVYFANDNKCEHVGIYDTLQQAEELC